MTKLDEFQRMFQSPERPAKPRTTGLTHMMDKGLGLSEARAVMEVGSAYVDIVKFGWGTSVVSACLAEKIELYREYDIEVCCGGSLFELAVQRGKLEAYIDFLHEYGFNLVEVSDGVLPMTLSEKIKYIERLAKEFRVLSEVGSKDTKVVVAPSKWVQAIKEELAAGSWKVVAEGRESGTIGLYRETGEIRHGLIEDIEAQIDPNNIIFECPQKAQQVWMIKHFGPNVNLGNIPPAEVIPLETLRQGLRADTMVVAEP
jgi:phosphosulfolactate synthase